MKIKSIFLISLLLIVITLSAVSASPADSVSDVQNDIEKTDILMTDDLDEDDDDDEDINDSYSEVSIDIPDVVEIGGGDDIEIELPEDAIGRVVITVDNSPWNTTSVSGEEDNNPNFSLDDLSCGLHLVNVTFISQNSKYPSISQQQMVNVTYNITITLEDQYIFAKDDNKVHVIAPSDILDEIKVIIDGNDYKLVKESTNSGYINISALEAGSHSIIASFEGNKNYTKYSTNETIRVISAIDAPLNALSYNEDAYVILKLPSDATGNLTLTVNSVLVDSVKLVNGEAKIKFPTDKVGSIYFTAKYIGDDYEISDVDTIVDVVPKVTVPAQMTVGQTKYITFDLNSGAGGYFEVEVDSEHFATVSGGRVSLASLDDGEFDISIIYYGGDDFIHYYDTYVVDIKSVPVKFVGIKNINMFYGDGTTYSITIYGSNGKPLEEDEYIEFKIGKKTYEDYTNSKGVVNFKIPDSVLPGKYSISVIYEDDEIHTVKSNIVVKQSLTLKKASVKKSAKKLVLKATLKKVNGKYLTNKKIVFKFNGKKYTAKTNKKGIAKLTIKANVLSKLTVGKKITYQATFLKNTVKKTVKVGK